VAGRGPGATGETVPCRGNEPRTTPSRGQTPGTRGGVRAKLTTPAHLKPAASRVAAHAQAVAPVVITSSTRTSGSSASPCFAPASARNDGSTRNTPCTFSARSARPDRTCRRPCLLRISAVLHGQPSSRASCSARRPAWLYPRSRRRARARGTGTRSAGPGARRRAAGAMSSPIREASDVQPLYFRPCTRDSAGGSCRNADSVRRSCSGHVSHSPHLSGDERSGSRVNPHRGHLGRGIRGNRDSHAPHTGDRPAATVTPHAAQTGGSRRSNTVAANRTGWTPITERRPAATSTSHPERQAALVGPASARATERPARTERRDHRGPAHLARAHGSSTGSRRVRTRDREHIPAGHLRSRAEADPSGSGRAGSPG